MAIGQAIIVAANRPAHCYPKLLFGCQFGKSIWIGRILLSLDVRCRALAIPIEQQAHFRREEHLRPALARCPRSLLNDGKIGFGINARSHLQDSDARHAAALPSQKCV